MRLRGTESVHESGMAIIRVPKDRWNAEQTLSFIEMAKSYKPVEEVVEARRHDPIKGTNPLETRAQRDDWVRGILDACED